MEFRRSPGERGLLLLLAAGILAAGLLLGSPRASPQLSPVASPAIVAEGLRVVCPVIRVPPKVDVNAANADELCELPGVGPVLASRIVAYRREHGPFASLEALTSVSGIGPATLEGFRERATIAEIADQ